MIVSKPSSSNKRLIIERLDKDNYNKYNYLKKKEIDICNMILPLNLLNRSKIDYFVSVLVISRKERKKEKEKKRRTNKSMNEKKSKRKQREE